MLVFLAVLLGLVSVALGLDLFRTRRFMRELEAAVSAERRMLLTGSPKTLKRLGVAGLVRETNGLIERYQRYSQENRGYSGQIETTLGSIQEAVLILGADHVIEFANESAQRLFQRRKSLRGARLESVLRSTSLLEFLEAYRQDRFSQLRQISIQQGDRVQWFEASCAELEGVSGEGGVSTLLVLHDISQLKRLEVVRRDFVANVSHELRTPLTIIKGFAETLRDDNATLAPDTRARFLDKILNNAQRLHVLVEDLLTLSRLESSSEQIRPVVQPLRPLVEEVIENCKTKLQTGRQRIVLDFDEAVGDFAFDRFRINQVLDNLVENAFRYAPDFKELAVRVGFTPDGRFVECRVRDDGPGIPAKDLPHIFERFYRVDKGRSRERGGTGLGLSIMKHIVQLHGGQVYAESELGKGTTFFFTLPYQRSAD